MPLGVLRLYEALKNRLFFRRRRLEVATWHLKFRTTRSEGAAATGIATLLLPRRPKKRRGIYPLVVA